MCLCPRVGENMAHWRDWKKAAEVAGKQGARGSMTTDRGS